MTFSLSVKMTLKPGLEGQGQQYVNVLVWMGGSGHLFRHAIVFLAFSNEHALILYWGGCFVLRKV